MKRKIAISVCRNRIAPVFDVSRQIIMLDGVSQEHYIDLPDNLLEKLQFLSKIGVTELICGAISRPSDLYAGELGIKTVSFVSASIEDVLVALTNNNEESLASTMPGCQRRMRCRMRNKIRN